MREALWFFGARRCRGRRHLLHAYNVRIHGEDRNSPAINFEPIVFSSIQRSVKITAVKFHEPERIVITKHAMVCIDKIGALHLARALVAFGRDLLILDEHSIKGALRKPLIGQIGKDQQRKKRDCHKREKESFHCLFRR